MINEPGPVPLRHAGSLYIDGQWVEPSSRAYVDVIRPDTEELYYRAGDANAADVDRAVTAAREAFDSGPWPRLSPQERGDYLVQMAEALRDRSSDIGTIWSAQVGVVHAAAQAGATGIAGSFKYYGGLWREIPFLERRKSRSGGKLGLLALEPVGLVGIIVPWNGPSAILGYKVAPALLAGCTIVVKSSPEAPGEALVLAEAAERVGLPPGVLNVLTADRQVSERLVRDSRVDKIAFTGSTAAGKRIGSLCAERVARSTLELGGKSAAVVFDDFDLGRAAEMLAGAQCFISGQVCAAVTRIIVRRDRHDEMAAELGARFAATRVGSQFDPETQMGPLATARQRARVEDYISAGKRDGARIVTGGGRPADLQRGFYVQPTVFADVDNTSIIAQEEIFGPVLCVIPAKDEADAIEIANANVYGLNAAVFTNDADRALSAARQLRCGTVSHNSVRADYSIGFGGFKQSGIGREGGVPGLLAFLESKTIILDDEPSSLE